MKNTILKLTCTTALAFLLVGCGESPSSNGTTGTNSEITSVPVAISSSDSIIQGKKYTITYNGGTDIRKITVSNSANQKCTFNVLDTTSAFNNYGHAYEINFAGYQPTTSYFIGSSASDVDFTVSWQYYTTKNSHVDFTVTCEDLPPVLTYAQQHEFTNMPNYTTVTQSLFFTKINRDSIGTNNEKRVITVFGNNRDYSNSQWTGLSIKINDKVIKVYETGDIIELKDASKIELVYDTSTKLAVVTIYNSSDVEIDSITKASVELNSYGEVKFSIESAEIKTGDSKLYHINELNYTIK